jgi:hypothetical protein
LLAGVPEQRVFYLDNPPSEAEISRVLARWEPTTCGR